MKSRGFLAAAVFVVGITNGVFGQSSAGTRFEVASIKPSVDGGPGPGGVRTFPGGRLTTQATILRSIIQFAFRLKPYQVLGGPDWINSARYDIEARAADNASLEQLFTMLQYLLEDRFKLKTTRQTRELPVYELVLVKEGAKLVKPQEGNCFVVDLNRPGRGAPPRNPGDGPPTPCGSVSMSAGPTGARLDGGQVTMSALIFTLSNMMGRPVIDKTGFTEKFDVHVSFTPDESLEGLPPRPPRGGQPVPLGEDPSRGTIFIELQKQLGLKLESAKDPVEVIVIDQVERPSPNGQDK